MATKKRAPKAHRKQYLLRTLRIEKGFAKLKDFSESIAMTMKKNSDVDKKNIMSSLSRIENGSKPSEDLFNAMKEVLKLSAAEITSLNKSFARTGTKKTAVKKKNKRKLASASVKLESSVMKPGMITPESAAKFSNAVQALGEISLERATQILGDLVTKKDKG